MSTVTEKYSAPTQDEYNEYYHRYVSLARADNFLGTFASQPHILHTILGNLSAEEASKLHEPYTWNLKQVVGHLIDCERIFSTRLLRIGVGDETPLPGMNQDIYVANLNYDLVTMQELLDEFAHLRGANVLLAKRLTTESLARRGIASDHPVSAKANLFIMSGHVEYHLAIIKKRLGLEA
ncbi:MAG: DinB family protein [Planctomycetales bacterium]|nr:DinB family protein [Planctomycetales bacterium]